MWHLVRSVILVFVPTIRIYIHLLFGDCHLCNLYNIVYPMQKHPGSLLEGFTQTQVSTIAVKDNLLVAGGFQGELICKVHVLYFL